MHGDVIAGVAPQSRQGAGRGGVAAEGGGAATHRAGLVRFSPAARGPGDTHRVAGHEGGPQVAGAAGCWNEAERGTWAWTKTAPKQRVWLRLSVCPMS